MTSSIENGGLNVAVLVMTFYGVQDELSIGTFNVNVIG
jgi:hypothetical protein